MARPAFLPDTGDDDYWERQKRELASLGQQVARDPLQAALGALDIGAWRIPIEAPAGLLGIAGQKALEALGGGRGEQERAVTEAVTRETEGMSPFQRALSTAFLYPAAASEAFRVSHQRAKERDEIPTADLPVVGKVSPLLHGFGRVEVIGQVVVETADSERQHEGNHPSDAEVDETAVSHLQSLTRRRRR